MQSLAGRVIVAADYTEIGDLEIRFEDGAALVVGPYLAGGVLAILETGDAS